MEYFFENEHIHKIHFVGIGGISMSALAKLCHAKGIVVSGADRTQSPILDELKNLGIKIFVGHSAKNVNVDCDLLVYTIAVGENNEEILQAKRLGIRIMERSDFLGLIANSFQNVIAVSGTHGKSTTCGMLGAIFLTAQKNPTIHIGGECEMIGGNLKIGGDEYFITEACEYKKHLLKLPHNTGVILNIEPDHPDSYKNLQDLHETFDRFCLMSKNLCVINEKYKVLLKDLSLFNHITFGGNTISNFYAKNIRQFRTGKIYFDCYKNNEFYAKIQLNIYGKHNVYNALACIAVADYYKISKRDIIVGLKSFSGIKRRFQFMGKINGNLVIEDYAHHPTEINAVINSAKQVFQQKILAVFQPHTYTRTKSLFTEFLHCFDYADEVVILPTYSAREKPIKNSSGKYLASSLSKIKKSVLYKNSFGSVKKYLSKKQNCVIMLIGAGDIELLAKDIKKDYLKNQK